MQKFQKTLKQKITFRGIGVHSGAPSCVTIMPASDDYGIVFCNAFNPDQKIVIGNVIPESAMHATVIKADGWYVSTIEHLMAALYVLGIDNVLIEVEGNEIPILDGSALPFAQCIAEIGFIEQATPKQYVTPRLELTFTDQAGRNILITPAQKNTDSFVFDYSAELQHPLAGASRMQGIVTQDFFLQEIAPARTFGFLHQLPFLRQHNLAQGTSLGNTIVIGDELLNDMRMPNECIRHKVLDLIGDLSLLGKTLIGTVTAHKTSHNFNRLVIEHFINFPEQWKVLSCTNQQ